jgi:hypothetical protein
LGRERIRFAFHDIDLLPFVTYTYVYHTAWPISTKKCEPLAQIRSNTKKIKELGRQKTAISVARTVAWVA